MRSKGYAFVEMLSVDEAKRAVSVLHDQDFMGRKLVVSGGQSSKAWKSERYLIASRRNDLQSRLAPCQTGFSLLG